MLDSARRATEQAPNSGTAWRNLGLALQEEGAFSEAFDAYGRALALNPNDQQVALALAICAGQLGLRDEAFALANHYVQVQPADRIGQVTLVNALLGLDRVREAHDRAVAALSLSPEDSGLWQLAGKTARASGGLNEAVQAFSQAHALDPENPRIVYDMAWTLADLGDLASSLDLTEQALSLNPDAETRAALGFLKATVLLAGGKLAEGWAAYSARNDLALSSAAIYELDLPRWDGTAPLEGRRLLLLAEQGLGDEIAFMGMMDDAIDLVGPNGRITLCADKRLRPLIERSWPCVTAIGHKTQQTMGRRHRWPDPSVEADLWAPLGDLLPKLRSEIGAFNQPKGFLKPCPERLAHWRAWLSSLPGESKIGMAWRSHKMSDERGRNFAPLSAWGPILARPNTSFISLQYGDTSLERAELLERFGVVVYQPPDLDLFNDLEGLAALSAALDLGIGGSNASTNLLGAVGTSLHLIAPPAPWPALGQSAYPWYQGAHMHASPNYGDWDGAMQAAAKATWP